MMECVYWAVIRVVTITPTKTGKAKMDLQSDRHGRSY